MFNTSLYQKEREHEKEKSLGKHLHCVKSVQIWIFFWSLFFRIRTEYGPEKTPYLDTFHAVICTEKRTWELENVLKCLK